MLARPLLAAALLLTAGASLAAQERRPIEAEDLYRFRTASNVAVSPDGRRVAYVVTRADSADNAYHRDLWIAASDGSERRQLTFTPPAGVGSPAFSPDGRWLAFTSRREGADGTQIYVLPLDQPGEARAVTSMTQGAANPVWSPDGRRLAFTSTSAEPPAPDTGRADEPPTIQQRLARNAARNDPRVVTRLDFLAETSIREERWPEIWVVEALTEGAEPVRVVDGAYNKGGLTWSPDGGSLLYHASPPLGDYHPDYELNTDLFRVAADGASAPERLTGSDEIDPRWLDPAVAGRADVERPGVWTELAPRPSPDGRRLAYLRRSRESHFAARNNELMVMAADGSGARCVSCEVDRSVSGVGWDDRSGRLYFTVGDEGARPLYVAEADGSRLRRVLDGPRGVLDFDVRAGTLAWIEMRPEQPSDVWVARADGRDARRLTELNDSLLAAVHVQPYEETWYAAPDGERIQGWIIRPPGFRPGAHPLAVEMHGGPHAMWGPGEASMWHEYQMLAGAGYVVFLSNPRGSEGYGFEFKRVIHRDWGDLPMGDVLAGADSVLARGWADPGRQTITGGSYAGYLTAWIIGRTDRFAAAVAQRGVYHMMGWYGGSNTWRLYESEFASVPWEDPELAWRSSPLSLVAEMTTPLLILHSEQDYRTTIATAEMLYRSLKVLGRDVEFVRYPREGHELSRSGEPHHRVDRLHRIRVFFDRYTQAEELRAGH